MHSITSNKQSANVVMRDYEHPTLFTVSFLININYSIEIKIYVYSNRCVHIFLDNIFNLPAIFETRMERDYRISLLHSNYDTFAICHRKKNVQ